MQRLVIALTALLSLTGALVVAAYLAFFSAATDRAAAFAPADSVAYVNVYLEPSAGQRMNLASVLGRFPGFGDAATLDEKIEEVAQRVLGDAGVDYRADIEPWLGGQVAIAVSASPEGVAGAPVVIAAVKDAAAAELALADLSTRFGGAATSETYDGVTLHTSDDGATYAIVDDMALLGASAAEVRAAIDTHAGGASLADDGAFNEAMDSLPSDHLASVYVNIERAAALGGTAADAVSGLSVATAALLAEPNGVHLVGSAPFDSTAPDTEVRASFGLLTEPSSLTDWMTAETQASAVVFGLADILSSLETSVGSTPEAGQALTQLRALAALGLGIDLDADLLPLLDREVALGLTGLSAAPSGVLVLRPSDPDAAAETLERIASALEARGSQRSDEESQGETITTLTVPQLGSVSYAAAEGVVLLALSPDDIAAALAAHASGRTLAASEAYRSTFDLAGARAGNELYVDVRSLLGAASDLAGLDAETRAILEPIRTFGLSAPALEDRLQFNAMVTVE